MKNLAALSPEQDYRFGQLFGWACEEGMDDDAACSEAWRGICEEWPELAKYDGAHPGVAE